MPELIKSIYLKRFRKFQNNILIATKRNVLVGENNSGKTSILHALRLFFFTVSGEFSDKSNTIAFRSHFLTIGDILPVANPDELWSNRIKGSAKSTGFIIELEFLSGLKVEAVFTYRFGQVHVDASVSDNPNSLTATQINDALDHKIAFIPGLVGILPHEAYVTPARRSAMSIEARYSEMYRSSLLHLNETDKNALRAINRVLKEHLKVEVTSLNFDPERDVFVDIKYSQNDIELDLSSAGSGMLQIIQLLVYIYLHKPTLLLIDEPDAHLHPELQERLGEILMTVSEEMQAQLFVATHSPDVIDAFPPTEVFFINARNKTLAPLKTDNSFIEGLMDAGIITNSSLSRIAVRPKCLIVEDSHIQIFKAIDAVLGTKLFDFAGDFNRAKGVSKFEAIHKVYLTVQQVVGKKIEMFFIQDRDGMPDRYINYIKKKNKEMSLDVDILERHEIENYLLDGKIIRAALKYMDKDVKLKDCRNMLLEAAKKIKSDTRGDIRRKCKHVNRFCGTPDGMNDNIIEADVDRWFDKLVLNEQTVLQVFPGKELMKALRTLITDNHGVDIRESHLRRAITKSRLPDDIKNIFTKIASQKKQ